MDLYYTIVFFVLGTVFGSFFNVVGYRLPKEESIVYPPSHCPKCNHQLGWWELIPVISYILLKGKCHGCHSKISMFYPIFEFTTGLLFALSYLLVGSDLLKLLLTLIFVSTLIIVFISDYQTMIIPDQVIIFALVSMSIIMIFTRGIDGALWSLLNGAIAFLSMWALKLLGDFLFKKESMGGGDIKLMFLFGLFFGWEMAIISIFLAAIIGLPVSAVILYLKKDHVIPFGPFLSMAALVITFLNINLDWIYKYLIIK